jgi:hypothetical protein
MSSAKCNRHSKNRVSGRDSCFGTREYEISPRKFSFDGSTCFIVVHAGYDDTITQSRGQLGNGAVANPAFTVHPDLN